MTGYIAGGRPAWLVRAREPCAVYPVLAGAALMVGAILGMRGREPVEIVWGAGFGACFLAPAWSDLRRRIIPNRIVYPALVLALAAFGAWPDRGFAEALAGGLGPLAVVTITRGLSGGGLGGGDVKMTALPSGLLRCRPRTGHSPRWDVAVLNPRASGRRPQRLGLAGAPRPLQVTRPARPPLPR